MWSSNQQPFYATWGTWMAVRRTCDVLWPVDGRMKHTTKVFQVKLAETNLYLNSFYSHLGHHWLTEDSPNKEQNLFKEVSYRETERNTIKPLFFSGDHTSRSYHWMWMKKLIIGFGENKHGRQKNTHNRSYRHHKTKAKCWVLPLVLLPHRLGIDSAGWEWSSLWLLHWILSVREDDTVSFIICCTNGIINFQCQCLTWGISTYQDLL